ncbi:MAG TPA: zinc ribbon domain-containing protein [Terracidiphilus sp.]|nr:zinc ribbon domain-containing protein [Terracidiphilus sp.]
MLGAMIIGGLVAGFLCGLVPFFVGKNKGQQDLGTVALLVCAACGMVLGILLALPAAIVFTIVIVNKASKAATGDNRLTAGVSPALPSSGDVCPKCTAKLEPEAKFCALCGNPRS